MTKRGRKPLSNQVITAIQVMRDAFPLWTIRQIASHVKVSPDSVYRVLSGTYGQKRSTFEAHLDIGQRSHKRDRDRLVAQHAKEIKEYRAQWPKMLKRHAEELAQLWESYQVGKPKRERGESLIEYQARLSELEQG